MKRLLTVDEAAEILSCHPKTIRRLLAAGKLEGGKIGSSVRITSKSLDTYIDKIIQSYQLENGTYIHEKNGTEVD